jgi:hypothetical protein
MFKQIAIAAGLAAALIAGHAHAKDVLVVTLEDNAGQRSVHHQATSHNYCREFLAKFKRNQKKTHPTKLTFEAEGVNQLGERKQNVTGTVLEAVCVLPSGRIIDKNGKTVEAPR